MLHGWGALPGRMRGKNREQLCQFATTTTYPAGEYSSANLLLLLIQPAGEYSPAGCAVRTGSRVVEEYSPAECTRDKPEAGEYSSASYLRHYPAGEYSLASYLHHYLLRWLGSTPRPRTCIATYSAG